MSAQVHVAVLIGSLRANSNSSRIFAELQKVAPASLRLKAVEFRDLPLYNEDMEGDKEPPRYVPFRAMMTKAEAVLFVTPEYNRSIPGGLKNAIDVASRPQGHGAILRKPAAIISSSSGATGGFGANHALRQSLVFLDMPVLQQPEAYLGNITQAIDESGRLTNQHLVDSLAKFGAAFERLIRQCTGRAGS